MGLYIQTVAHLINHDDWAGLYIQTVAHPINHDDWAGLYIQTVAHPHLLQGACKDVCPFLLVDKDDDGRIDATAEEGDQLLSLVTLRHHQHLLLHILSWLACRRKRPAEPELEGIQIARPEQKMYTL